MKSLLLAFLFIATSVAGISAMQKGIVDLVKEEVVRPCTDGIGRTYLLDEQLAVDEDDLFNDAEPLSACTADGLLYGHALMATCSPAVGAPTQETLGVYCSISLRVPTDGPSVELTMDQFVLASNDGHYLPDVALYETFPVDQDLAHGPIEAASGEDGIAYVAFAIPVEHETSDLVLIWRMPSALYGESGGVRNLRILVEKRDPSMTVFSDYPDYSAPETTDPNTSSMTSGSGTADSLSGSSDAVSEPVQDESADEGPVPTDEQEPPRDTTAPGTLESPVPLGEALTTPGWRIVVHGSRIISYEETIEEYYSDLPPDDGKVYLLVDVAFTNITNEPIELWDTATWGVLPPSNVVVEEMTYPAPCGVFPNKLRRDTEIFPGGTYRANACFQVDQPRLNETVFFIEDTTDFSAPDWDKNRRWFSLG